MKPEKYQFTRLSLELRYNRCKINPEEATLYVKHSLITLFKLVGNSMCSELVNLEITH